MLRDGDRDPGPPLTRGWAEVGRTPRSAPMTAIPHEHLGPQGDALILELRRLQWALARESEDAQHQAAPELSAHVRASGHPRPRNAGPEQTAQDPRLRGGDRSLDVRGQLKP